MTGITITCDLTYPRNATVARVPACWASDSHISFAALGLLARVFNHARPGVRLSWLADGIHPPPPDLLAELVDGGYLIPSGGDRFELVHPDRLPPLPSA